MQDASYAIEEELDTRKVGRNVIEKFTCTCSASHHFLIREDHRCFKVTS